MNANIKFGFIFCLLAIYSSYSQVKSNSFNNKNESYSCSYYGLSNTKGLEELIRRKTLSFSNNDEAFIVIDDILEQVGLSRNFEILEDASTNNAAAVVFEGKRYILYNNEFMNIADDIAATRWASVSILAHEIGHHLQGHTLMNTGSRPQLEIEADKFSGFVLAKMGASLEDAQRAILTLVSNSTSSTHPAKNERLLAIANGYKSAIKNINKVENNLPNKIEVVNNDLFIDIRDQKSYETVQIDDMIWMNSNMDFQSNSSKSDLINPSFGKFYSLIESKKVCPKGWRLASSADWKKLNSLLINSSLHRSKFKFFRYDSEKQNRDTYNLYYWTSDNLTITIDSYDEYLQNIKSDIYYNDLMKRGGAGKLTDANEIKSYKYNKEFEDVVSKYSKKPSIIQVWDVMKSTNRFRCRCIKL